MNTYCGLCKYLHSHNNLEKHELSITFIWKVGSHRDLWFQFQSAALLLNNKQALISSRLLPLFPLKLAVKMENYKQTIFIVRN